MPRRSRSRSVRSGRVDAGHGFALGTAWNEVSEQASHANPVVPQFLSHGAQAAANFAERRRGVRRTAAPAASSSAYPREWVPSSSAWPRSFSPLRPSIAPSEERPCPPRDNSSRCAKKVRDDPFPNSHPVAVMAAPESAWRTIILHVGADAKWDDVKKHVVSKLPRLPPNPGVKRVEHEGYRLVTQFTGRSLHWNAKAEPTMENMAVIFAERPGADAWRGVWGGPDKSDAERAAEQECVSCDISAIVLAPSKWFSSQGHSSPCAQFS